MNALEQVKLIGKTGTLRGQGIETLVRITDVKQVYGQIRYYVTPVSGTGSVWVSADRVTLESEVSS